jgi:hypothetical protein
MQWEMAVQVMSDVVKHRETRVVQVRSNHLTMELIQI